MDDVAPVGGPTTIVSMRETLMPDGSKRVDTIWDKALHKGEPPPTGIWLHVLTNDPFKPTTAWLVVAPIVVGLLVTSLAAFRPSAWLILLVMGFNAGLLVFLFLWFARRADDQPPGESHLFIAAGEDPNKNPQAAVSKSVAALGWKVIEDRPLIMPHGSLRGRVWEFESGIALHYAIGGVGPQHMLAATAKHENDAERFALMKGAVLAGLEGAPSAASNHHVVVVAKASSPAARIDRLSRDPPPPPLDGPPDWAMTPLPIPPFERPDARAPPRKPDALPVGWWASTPRGRDVHGGLRPNPRWVGAIAGLFMALILPAVVFAPSSSRLAPFTATNYALAVLVLAPPCIYGLIWYARRELGDLAISYLRIRSPPAALDSIHATVEESLKRHFPEVARSASTNPEGVEWKDVEGLTHVFVWRSKSGGDPLLELRSTAPATKVIQFKGAVSAALYGEPSEPR